MRILLLIIVLIAVVAWWPDPPVPTAEESVIGPQIQTLNKARDLEQEYLEGLDKKKAEVDKRVDGG
jgi:hypothetical protein